MQANLFQLADPIYATEDKALSMLHMPMEFDNV